MPRGVLVLDKNMAEHNRLDAFRVQRSMCPATPNSDNHPLRGCDRHCNGGLFAFLGQDIHQPHVMHLSGGEELAAENDTSGNGRRTTGTTTTPVRPPTVRPGWRLASTPAASAGSSAAAPGTSRRAPAGLPTGPSTRRAPAATPWAFAAPEFRFRELRFGQARSGPGGTSGAGAMDGRRRSRSALAGVTRASAMREAGASLLR